MHSFKSFNPKDMEIRDVHQLLLSSIAPRPIGFTSSISKNGNINLAPFSYHNAFSTNPPVIGISPAFSGKTGKAKNTLTNILETNEFALSIVTYEMVEQMNICAAEYPNGVNEFLKSGLEEHSSKIISAPGVKSSPLIMECKLIQHIELSSKPAGGNLLLGEIVQFHADTDIYNKDGKIDPKKIDQVARLGYNWYTRANNGLFELPAPKHLPIGVDALPDKIKKCSYFKGKHLARLASVEKIPEPEINRELIATYSRVSKDEKLKICSTLVDQGRIIEGWQILYLAEII